MIDLDALPVAAIVVDADGRIAEANRLATELLDADVVTGRTVEDLLADLDVGRPGTQRCFVSGTAREVQCRVAPVAGGTVVVTITEPSVDPTAAETIALVSHELRSPLTALRGYVGLLRTRWDRIDDAQKLEILDQIDVDAERVARLVTELLDISRLDAGRLRLRAEPFHLEPVVRRVVERLSLSEPALACRLEFPDELPAIIADRGKVEQVLVNLVENAAKYGSADDIVVRAEACDGELTVAVTDRGPGVASADRELIFGRFYRREEGRPDGLGLGLFISRALAEAHGGRLELAANAEPGATFCLTLPLQPPDPLP